MERISGCRQPPSRRLAPCDRVKWPDCRILQTSPVVTAYTCNPPSSCIQTPSFPPVSSSDFSSLFLERHPTAVLRPSLSLFAVQVAKPLSQTEQQTPQPGPTPHPRHPPI